MNENLQYWFKKFKDAGLIGFCFLLFESFLFQVGENDPFPKIEASMDAQEEVLFYQEINKDLLEIKFRSVQKTRPDVVTVGNSRVNMFRAKMFEPYSFYNLSNTVVNFSRTIGLINLFDSTYVPKYMFVIVEPLQFVEGFSFGVTGINIHKKGDPQIRFYKTINFLSKLGKRSKLKANWDNIGLKAIYKNRGLRTFDGSAYWGKQLSNTKERQIELIKKSEKKLKPIFKKEIFLNYDAPLCEDAFLEFEALNKAAQEKGVTIIGITPPYSAPIQKVLDSDSIKYQVWHDFQKASTSERLNSYGGFYFNFSRFEYSNSKYYEMMDMIHPSEKIIGRMLVKMLENEKFRKLLPLIDVQKINDQINSTDLPILDVFSEHPDFYK